MDNKKTTQLEYKTMVIFSKYFLGDVCFTLLPLAVIFLIRKAIGGESHENFWLLPDWSFAAIVIYGITTTHSLELKIRYQRDTSEKVFALLRLCVLGLIASVLSLALSEMRAYGLDVSVDMAMAFQFAVLGCGLSLLFLSHVAREDTIRERNSLEPAQNEERYFRFLANDLERTNRRMNFIARKIELRHTVAANTELEVQGQVELHVKSIEHLLSDMDESMKRMRLAHESWEVQKASAGAERVRS